MGLGELGRVAEHPPQQGERGQQGEREGGEDQPWRPLVRALDRGEDVVLGCDAHYLPARVLNRGGRVIEAGRERPDGGRLDGLGEALHRHGLAGLADGSELATMAPAESMMYPCPPVMSTSEVRLELRNA